MVAKKQAVTYIDEMILQAKTNEGTWRELKSYFHDLRSLELKAEPNKTKLF